MEEKKIKETYYRLSGGSIWSQPPQQKSIAAQIGIKTKSPTELAREEERKKYPSGRRLRTYQSDIAKIIQEQRPSQVDIAIAEQKKQYKTGARERKKMSAEQKERMKTVGLVVFGILLIASGALSFYFFFIKKTIGTGTVPAPVQGSLIFADSRKELPLPSGTDRRAFVNAIAQTIKDAKESGNSITEYRIVEKGALGSAALPTGRFFSLLETHAPDALLRSLDPVFSFGIHTLIKNEPFFVFKTTFFESAFAGMLDFEQNMEPDLGPLFSNKASPIPGRPFEDDVIKNKDTRVIRNQSGAILFFYTFPDREHLILVTNETTLSELIPRLGR